MACLREKLRTSLQIAFFEEGGEVVEAIGVGENIGIVAKLVQIAEAVWQGTHGGVLNLVVEGAGVLVAVNDAIRPFMKEVHLSR